MPNNQGRSQPFVLSVTVDFPDDVMGGSYTSELLDSMMAQLKAMGFSRVYWLYYGDAEPESYWGGGLFDYPLIKYGRKTVDLIGEPLNGRHRVGGDGDRCVTLVEQAAQALQLGLAHDVVRNQDVRNAAGDHSLGLAQLLADDTDGSARYLHVGDLGGLVCLRVDPQADAHIVAGLLHVTDVLVHDVQIDN